MTDSADFDDLVTIDQVIARARESIEPGQYEWGAAGAGQGVTTTSNSLALNRLALIPRVLRDVSSVDTCAGRRQSARCSPRPRGRRWRPLRPAAISSRSIRWVIDPGCEIADRAEQAGFAGICVTVDSPVIGRRDRSLESGFSWAVPADGTDSLNRHGFDYAYRALGPSSCVGDPGA